MRRGLFLNLLVLGIFGASATLAQSPAPVLIEAITPPPAAVAVPASAVASAAPDSSTMKLLQEMRAANEATIKKQAAALEALDALQKAADEIKIYGKRG